MLSARLTVVSPEAGTIVRSLTPEASRDISRTHVSVSLDGDVGVICIDSSDSTAMRAALNSYLGCIRITENIGKITKVKE